MLTYHINNLQHILNVFIHTTDSIDAINTEPYNLLKMATLMIQFGTLVFVLSIVALASPNQFGLYGSFILTIIPLFFA